MMAVLRSCLLVTMMLVFAGALSASVAQDVTLDASRDCYELGDSVSFTLTNNRNSTIYMPHDPTWTVFDAGADTLVYPSVYLWVIVTLAGNSAVTYTWTQTDYHSNSVPAGRYWVEVSYSPQMDPWAVTTVADTFDIKVNCPSTALEASSWGSIKRLYR